MCGGGHQQGTIVQGSDGTTMVVKQGAYCGCETTANKIAWSLIGLGTCLSVVLWVLLFLTAAECDDAFLRTDHQECKDDEDLLFIVASVVSVLASIPSYYLCCCSRPPPGQQAVVNVTPPVASVVAMTPIQPMQMQQIGQPMQPMMQPMMMQPDGGQPMQMMPVPQAVPVGVAAQ